MLFSTTRRVYLGVGREYDEYLLVYDTHTKGVRIIHTGTFADEGFISTVNINTRRH